MSKQDKLLSPSDAVEDIEFEPIKGYPMLHWRGKRPFKATKFYPAQLKETYGKDVDGWRNKIFWGDNLQVMSHLLKEFRGKVDLIYIDPPFDSKADYRKQIVLRNDAVTSNPTAFEEKQYSDIWANDEYLQFMYERLILCREMLSETGTLFIHLDWRMNSYIRLILDEIFGQNQHLNQIIWRRSTPTGGKKKSKMFPRDYDVIISYKKSEENIFNNVYVPYSAEYVDNFFTKKRSRWSKMGISVIR